MSKIRRMSLRGIRNFGEDNDDEPIRFSCPLTLILGPNGTGKTTIIEALKYVTTGQFPPGSESGKYFVHDPILSTTGSVRGVVKAEIIDATGNIYNVSRTLEMLKSNHKLKTLDSTVTRINKDKQEKTSITNRCANVDAELSVIMGVSKSILNYVIFCHQDELNWPIDQQGKVLKERFDEIFGSAKFNKALENITKISKDLDGEIRGLKVEKEAYNVIVAEVDDKEAKLENYNKRLDDTKKKITDIDDQLKPLKQKIEEMQQFDSEYRNAQTEEEKKKMECNVHKERYEKLKESINDIFEGTTEELNVRIESYDTMVKEKNVEIGQNEAEIKAILEKAGRISTILATRRETVGTLKQQVNDHEKRIVRRNQLLNEALQAWNFETMESDVSEIEVKALTKRLEQKMRALEQEVEDNRSAMQKQEKELQKDVDVQRSNHSKIESEMVLKDKEVTTIRGETDAIRNQITQIGAAGNKLKVIEQKIQAAKQIIDELGNTLDVDSVKTEIGSKIKSRDKIEASLSAIDDEISSLHKLSSLTTEFELNKSTLRAKEDELEDLKKKHGDKIKALLNIQELQQIKLKTTLERIYRQLEEETNSLTREIQTQQCKTTAFETTMRYVMSDIGKKKMELNNDKEKISAVCNYKDFDETLLLQSKIVKDLQEKRGIYVYQATAYKDYIRKLSAKNPCCPLCHRNFEEQNKVTDLIKEIESDIIRNQPDRLKKYEEELKTQQDKYDEMLQLRPIVEKVIQCEENEMKKLEERLERTKNNVKQSKMAVKDLEASKAEPEKKLLLYKNMMGDIKFWDRCIDEIESLKKIVNNLTIQMANAGVKTTEKTIEEAQAQRESLKTSLRETRNNIEALQLKLNKHTEKMQDARARYNELHEEQLKIQTDMQKLKHLEDKKKELYTREIVLVEMVEKLRRDLSEAEDQLDFATQQLEKAKTENWKKQESDRKSVADSARRLSDLRKIIDEVDSFISSNVSEKLARFEREIESYQASLTELTNKREILEQMISKMKEDVAAQEIGKRELLDNVTLRKVKETLEVLKEECRKLNEKIKNMNYHEKARKWQQLENEKQVLLQQRNVTLGSQEELERVIRQYKKELNKEVYRLARRNYTDKCIELTVQQDTIANLKVYSKILDAAMIDYHEERMSTVNTIMKKLWKHIYKGTDTTGIEICTEPTDMDTNKRSYKYKVVQTKHGCKMDMKGRCSAGQKVLASIIIRLALAETFCKDCGILALDEPTTNLDEENANSLADTLTKVVEMRSRHQKNFQLIIISHDETFLQKLADLNDHKKFYELYRKQNGMTAIKRSTFNEPVSSLVHVKSEDESDREECPNQVRNAAGTSTNASTRKRYNSNDFNEEDRPATKRKYRFE